MRFHSFCLMVGVLAYQISPMAASQTIVECRAIKSDAKRLRCYDTTLVVPTPAPLPVKPLAPPPLPEWDKEPDSFLSIKLDVPIQQVLSQRCPAEAMQKPGPQFNDYMWERIGKPRCYIESPDGQWATFKAEVKEFHDERIFLYADKIVGQVRVNFFSSVVGEIYESLTAKFGPPTVSTKAAVRLTNGAEIPNTIHVWAGKNAALSLNGFSSRSDGINYGNVTYASKKYQSIKQSEDEKALNERIKKF